MNRQELGTTLTQLLEVHSAAHQATIWTALPAILQTFDRNKMTAEVQPAVQARVTNPDGSIVWVKLPKLVDCPVMFPSAGGFTLTFPVDPGDECLVVLASRCIDGWWQSGGVQIPPDLRMHDLSDGFVLLGGRSQPRVLSPTSSTNAVELRADNRTSYVAVDRTGKVTVAAQNEVAVTAGTSATITAPTIVLNGNVTINGNTGIAGTLTNNGVPVGSTHVHNKNGAAAVTLGPQAP
jgi:hypothetical protein